MRAQRKGSPQISAKKKIISSLFLMVVGFLFLYGYNKDVIEPIADIVYRKEIKAEFEIFPQNPWLGENITVTVDVRNIGKDKEVLSFFLNDSKIEEMEIESGRSRNIQVSFSANHTGIYEISLNWENKKLNALVEVIAPVNPLERPAYYYKWAKRYVSENYEIPSIKNIEGLIEFLNQIVLPKYEKGTFDCSECSSLLEWLLEGAGFHAYIAHSYYLYSYEGYPLMGHDWIQIEIADDVIAIESTQLTDGWGQDDSVKPWGIIMKSNGEYRELTYDYRYKYQMFLDWKEKYSSSIYVWNRNITFDEWKKQYMFPSLVIPQLGIPTNDGYYSLEDRQEFPSSGSECDWWNVEPYSDIFPFSEWG